MKNIQLLLKSLFFSVLFAVALSLGAGYSFAADPDKGDDETIGFDFTDDPNVIKEQEDDAKKAKEAEEKKKNRIVSSESLARDMQEQVKLLQSAALCYAKEDPFDYESKCTPSMRALLQFRFNVQELRGGQIKYKTNAEKTAIMNAATQFDEMWPAAINVMAWCADSCNVQDFAKKYVTLRKLNSWYDDLKDKYISTIKDLESRLNQAMVAVNQNIIDAEKGVDSEIHSTKITRQEFLRSYRLNDFASVSGENWISSYKSCIFWDLDMHKKLFEGSNINPFVAAHTYFIQEVTKFNPFFVKWRGNVEKIDAPYNASMSRILDITNSTVKVFVEHAKRYEEIMNEAQNSSGLGGIISGDVTKGNKWFVVSKGIKYDEAIKKALEVVWKQCEAYNKIVAK